MGTAASQQDAIQLNQTMSGSKTTVFHVDSRPGRDHRDTKADLNAKKTEMSGKPNTPNPKQPLADELMQNLDFYMNKIPSKPAPGNKIEEMLKWKGDYRQLETNHRYIQWLFPIPDSGGMNPEAQPLLQHEIEQIQSTSRCRKRLVEAYEMMLDFYGIRLVSRDTGDVARTTLWKSRFKHLNKSIHNCFRITRILKCLGCMGLIEYQMPLVQFFINEILVTRELSGIRNGTLLHWIDSLSDENDVMVCNEYFIELSSTEKYETTRKDKVESKQSDKSDKQHKDKAEMSKEYDSNEPSAAVGLTQNLEFYRNEIKSKPKPGNKIEEMLKWKGDYNRLETNHRYIQWLFPIPDTGGMNPSAQPLQHYEIEQIRDTPKCIDRLVNAYEMMLDFYGIRLVSRDTGEVDRTETWKSRFEHLNKSIHNTYRISRILKCLGCFGLAKYQKPLVQFFLNEILVTRALPDVKYGVLPHWIDSLLDENDKQECYQFFQDCKRNTDESIMASIEGFVTSTKSIDIDQQCKDVERTSEEYQPLEVNCERREALTYSQRLENRDPR